MAQPTYPHNIVKDYVWWLEDDKIAIAYVKDTATVNENYPRPRSEMGEYLSPHEATQVRLHVVKKAGRVGDEGNAGKMTELTHEPEFPTEFHEALVMYAIFKGYERSADGLENAQYFKAEYLKKVLEGQRYTGIGRYGGPSQVTVNKKLGIL